MSAKVIPQLWLSAPLEEVIQRIVGGGTPSKSKPEYYQGNIPWMSVKDMNKYVLLDTIDHISSEAVENSSTNVIPAGTPIIATRMSLGKIVVANFDSAINQDLKALFLPAGIHRDYLVYWYRSVARSIEQMGTGTTVKGIRLEALKGLKFALPPFAEQKVIADKLDTLLAQVENTKARLERIPTILKRFRQSVLAAAVSGRLTEEWRGTPSSSFGQPPLTIGQDTEEAPNGWRWEKLIDLAILESGHTPRKSKPEYWEHGDIPWISLQDIRKAHGKVITNTKFMPNMEGINNSSARLLPAGTVCFSRDISVGYTTVMGREMATTQHFVNWVCGDKINNIYLMYSFMAAKNHLTISGQGSTVKTIYMPACKQFRILTPPLEEQTEIVRRVDQLFAHADRIEQQVNQALARVNNLTQSILAKAFRGEFTEQWRKDNPELISGKNSAEALQERIKEERAANAPKKAPRKKAFS